MKKSIAAVAVGALLAVLPGTSPAAAQTTPTCFGQPATIVAQPGQVTRGTSGPDVIVGTNGPDVIRGRGGADLICSRGGADDVKGGGGADMIDLGKGSDTAEGGKGGDTIYGRSGHDTISGNSGRDTIYGNKGNDEISGGKSGDTLYGGSKRDVIRGNSGKDDCYGGSALDTLFSCNEGTDAIDVDDAFVTQDDLDPSEWAVPVNRTPVTDAALLRVCGTDLENDIGVPDLGEAQQLLGFEGSAPAGTVQQSVRLQTERTAREVTDRTNAAVRDCTWVVRDDVNDVTNTFTMLDAPMLTTRGESFSVYVAEQEVDFDDPATTDFTAVVVVNQIQCGPVISRLAFQWLDTPSVSTLNDLAAAAEAKLSAALQGTGHSCG
ncbi:MAG: calcium-binding protein [Actinomycetota bacterium]